MGEFVLMLGRSRMVKGLLGEGGGEGDGGEEEWLDRLVEGIEQL